MKFIDSYRFAPVVFCGDIPWKEDLFHVPWEDVPRNKKDRTKFIKENDIIIDYDWWKKQADRCRNGYTVENAIEKGGDSIRDGIECVWKHNDCFLEDYDITIKDKSVHISGRYYFYLNFWWIYGLEKNGTVKKIIHPRFLDMDFLFDLRGKLMYLLEKDSQELKARQLGFSEKTAGMWLAWNYTFLPASVNLIVAGLQEDADHTMENTIRGLDMLINTQFYLDRKRGGDSRDTIISINGSQVRSQTAKDKPETLSRYCFGKDTKVRMYNGSIKKIQNIKVNDLLMGIDSSKRKVLSTHNGTDIMYRISSEKIEPFTCNSNHLLYFYHKPGRVYINKREEKEYGQNNFKNKKTIRIDDTHFLMRAEDFYNTSKTFKRRCFIEKCGGIQYKKKNLLIDPYFIGLWLGDGEKGSLRLTVNKEEQGIIDYLNYFAFSHCHDLKIEETRYFDFIGRCSKASRYSIVYRDRSGRSFKKRKSYLLEEFRNLGILNNKFIPNKYLYSSREDRLQLLAGLIDTDGWKCKTKDGFEHYSISQIDKHLIYQIKELVESLGFYANVSDGKDNGYVNGYKGKPIYDMYISGNGIHNIPVRLTKKKITKYEYKQNPLLSSIKIEKLEKDEYYGISIDKDQLFLLNDYTVVHNSPTFVLYEEIGKGKKGWSLEVQRYVRPSTYTEGKKTAFSIYIGTGGDVENGVYDLEQRYFKPQDHDILQFKRRHTQEYNESYGKVGSITPKWMFLITDKDGNSLRQQSIKKLEDDCPIGDEARYTYWSQHAIFDHHIFMTQSGGYFGKDIVISLNQRKIEIKNRQELQIERKGILEPIDPTNVWKGVRFVDKQDGWWIKIIEEPEIDTAGKPYANLYKAGIDSYDRDEALTSASKGAFHVRKMYRKGQESPHYNTFVASIVERPKTSEGGAEKFYYHTILGCIYYGCRANVEYGANNMRIFDYYIKNGFEVLLKERPEIAFAGQIKRSMISNRYGTDESLKHQGLAILKNSLTPEFINRMFLLDQIEAFSRFKLDKDYNCDITMSSMEAEIIAKDEEMYVVFSQVEQNKNKTKGLRVFEMDSNGRLMQKII